jgi:hypothetical protein
MTRLDFSMLGFVWIHRRSRSLNLSAGNRSARIPPRARVPFVHALSVHISAALGSFGLPDARFVRFAHPSDLFRKCRRARVRSWHPGERLVRSAAAALAISRTARDSGSLVYAAQSSRPQVRGARVRSCMLREKASPSADRHKSGLLELRTAPVGSAPRAKVCAASRPAQPGVVDGAQAPTPSARGLLMGDPDGWGKTAQPAYMFIGICASPSVLSAKSIPARR